MAALLTSLQVEIKYWARQSSNSNTAHRHSWILWFGPPNEVAVALESVNELTSRLVNLTAFRFSGGRIVGFCFLAFADFTIYLEPVHSDLVLIKRSSHRIYHFCSDDSANDAYGQRGATHSVDE